MQLNQFLDESQSAYDDTYSYQRVRKDVAEWCRKHRDYCPVDYDSQNPTPISSFLEEVDGETWYVKLGMSQY